ncbi:hypothetical protein MNBD_GAMMA08-2086, partial [hydrothermal vent metagenome]
DGNNNSDTTIYFITSNNYTIRNAATANENGFHLKQLNLDAHRNLEKELSRDLPLDDVEKSQQIAEQRVANTPIETLQGIFKSIALTIQWDIRKVPAFVFNDGGLVIYGVTDVEEAIQRFNFWSTRSRR